MSLQKYATACIGFESELKESLTKEDIAALRKDCAAMGIHDWCRWGYKYRQIISAFLSSTPSQRKNKKAWQDPAVKRLLVLAALYEAKRAYHLLEGLVQHEHYLAPGYSYREMSVNASQAYRDIFYRKVPNWPFDSPDPFRS